MNHNSAQFCGILLELSGLHFRWAGYKSSSGLGRKLTLSLLDRFLLFSAGTKVTEGGTDFLPRVYRGQRYMVKN